MVFIPPNAGPPSGPAPTPQMVLRTMRIINAAMIAGVVFALALLTYFRLQKPPAPHGPPIVSFVILALAAIQLVLTLVVPNAVAASAARRITEPGGWYAVYQTRLIVRLALLEGAALALTVAWFLEGLPIILIAALLFVALLVVQFPSAGRVERWVEAQKELAYQNRAPS